MRRIALLLTLLAAPLALAALSTVAAAGPTSSPAGPSPAAAGTALDGKKIFLAEKCNLCHSIEVAGIEATTKSDKMKGPDLGAVEPELKGDELMKFLRQTATRDGEKHKKAFKGSDEELGALLGWLTEQRKKAGAKKRS